MTIGINDKATIEQAGVAVTFYTSILKVPSSNLGRYISSLAAGSFRQVLDYLD
jgi:hypothetical protein